MRGDVEVEKATILIVDDEKFYLDVLIGILKTDYRVLVARSGEEAQGQLQRGSRPDLILLDLLMPGIDGYETCRRIKSNPATSDIPLIFLTSRDDVEGETLGLGLGAVDYITKPISPPTVKARIQTHLALRRAQCALERQNEVLEERVKERTESLRKVGAELVLAEERERRRIARELHDGPTQRLVLSKINLGRLKSSLEPGPCRGIDDVLDTIDITLKELRTLMVQLSPPVLYELGLGPAVEWLAENILGEQGIQFRVDSAESYDRLKEETRVFLFRAIRELMLNIVKHAQASRSSVSINTTGNEILIEVRDDGVGMDYPVEPEAQVNGGFGLFVLRDRIDMLGGKLSIGVNGGTCVTLRVPIGNTEVEA
ncbi:MAG: response regulator [Gammaproteobacteria bacterium]|nr:response regulator [Gammaproteobacteria bacterium]